MHTFLIFLILLFAQLQVRKKSIPNTNEIHFSKRHIHFSLDFLNRISFTSPLGLSPATIQTLFGTFISAIEAPTNLCHRFAELTQLSLVLSASKRILMKVQKVEIATVMAFENIVLFVIFVHRNCYLNSRALSSYNCGSALLSQGT